MKIGVFLVLFQEQPLEKALDYVKEAGVEAVEIGCGNYPGDAHCRLKELLGDEKKLQSFKGAIHKRNLEISALSCHGNPLHPQSSLAGKHKEVQHKTILLAERLEVNRVNTFSGCPGASGSDIYPNWVTCPWPDDFSKVVKWQWEEKVIPFWREEVEFAKKHKVRICLEPHPGFVVYNTETLLKLREAVGETIGANLDPSHLFWQGMDPIKVVRELGSAIYHVHAKDTKIDPVNTPINGVLDTKPYSEEIKRSWIFRTVGYGHSCDFWKDFVSALRLVGYDDVLSIEHEDSLMSVNEGFRKAVKFLKEVIVEESKTKMWWYDKGEL